MKQLAIVGYGTVGGGVDRFLTLNEKNVTASLGEALSVKYILVRRERGIPDSRKITDFAIIERDPDIWCVVETIGGCEAAKEYTERALRAGKHVVTANKELVARHGRELLRLAEENGVSYLFEASVGGGIPVLHALMYCLKGNSVKKVCGILNGTTNYILSKMDREAVSFAAALQEAQALGYAEPDPTADIMGLDTGRKICILADLSFGKRLLPEQVSTEGITHIQLADVQAVRQHGYRIRLLGCLNRRTDGSIYAYVAPHILSEHSPLATVENVYNAILVRSDPLGDTMFYGQGAGALPTASAIVSDMMNILQQKSMVRPQWDGDMVVLPTEEQKSRWYLRAKKQPKNVTSLGKWGEDYLFLTKRMTAQEVKDFCSSCEALACMRVWE